MKKLGISLLVAFALCVGLMGTALANGKNLRKTVTIDQDVMVNGQLVKKGTYQVKFVAADSSVLIENDNGVLATTKVSVKEGLKKSPYNSLGFTTTDKGKMLTTITFEGDKRTLHIADGQNATADE